MMLIYTALNTYKSMSAVGRKGSKYYKKNVIALKSHYLGQRHICVQ